VQPEVELIEALIICIVQKMVESKARQRLQWRAFLPRLRSYRLAAQSNTIHSMYALKSVSMDIAFGRKGDSLQEFELRNCVG
jgi:hypothetical protein